MDDTKAGGGTRSETLTTAVWQYQVRRQIQEEQWTLSPLTADLGWVKWAEQEHAEALGAYLALAAIVLAPQCFGPPAKESRFGKPRKTSRLI